VKRCARSKSNPRALIFLVVGRVICAIASRGKPFEISLIEPKGDTPCLTFSVGIGRLNLSGHSEPYRFEAFEPMSDFGR
jgi:hypothetical protein